MAKPNRTSHPLDFGFKALQGHFPAFLALFLGLMSLPLKRLAVSPPRVEGVGGLADQALRVFALMTIVAGHELLASVDVSCCIGYAEWGAQSPGAGHRPKKPAGRSPGKRQARRTCRRQSGVRDVARKRFVSPLGGTVMKTFTLGD